MKRLSVILALVISVLLVSNSCTKKDLKITLKEDGCAKFKIFGATYQTIADPSCGGSPLTAVYKITFEYSGNIECLQSIKLSPEILNASNAPVAATYITEILTEGNADVDIDENAKTCTFRFEFTFSNSTDADNYDHCYIRFHTENTQGESSKDAQVRIAGNCSQMIPGQGYDDDKPVDIINVSTSSINLRLWDDGAEDGDIVTVYLNGLAVAAITNHSLTNAGTTFNIPINSGRNDLVLVAMNQGSVGPNTCALSVNGGTTINMDLDLKTGQFVQIMR